MPSRGTAHPPHQNHQVEPNSYEETIATKYAQFWTHQYIYETKAEGTALMVRKSRHFIFENV